MAESADVFSKIEEIAEQIMQFIVRSICTLALLIFRPFRVVTKLFTEKGELRQGYVQPVAFAVLTSFVWFIGVQFLTSKALTSYFFSHNTLMWVYQRVPHQFDLFDMVLSVVPMLIFIHFVARLIIKVSGSTDGWGTFIYRIILFGCSTQCLLFPLAYLLHIALIIWRLFHIQTGTVPGFHYSATVQMVYWGAHVLVFGYLLLYPGLLLQRGFRLMNAKQRLGIERILLSVLLVCSIAGPGFIALGAGTSAFKALFREKESGVALKATMGLSEVFLYGTNKFSFDVDLIVHNETPEPILLKNGDFNAEFTAEGRKYRLIPAVTVQDGADHPRQTRLLAPGQATWFSLRLEALPWNLGLQARGDSREFTGTISLTAARFLGVDEETVLPKSDPLNLKLVRNY